MGTFMGILEGTMRDPLAVLYYGVLFCGPHNPTPETINPTRLFQLGSYLAEGKRGFTKPLTVDP